MANQIGRCSGIIWAFVLVIIGCSALFVSAEPVIAGDQPTEAQIQEALKPRVKTRGLSQSLSDPKADEQRRFIDGLRTRSARSLTVEEREKIADIAKEKPSIDLEINFDFNSATIGPRAVPVLLVLGGALSKDEFKGTVFLINGHTDAKGGVEYNQDLSERRAEAVKRLLVQQFNLPVATLIAVGYGKMQLKNRADPFAGENRRVQIVNTEQKATANRQ